MPTCVAIQARGLFHRHLAEPSLQLPLRASSDALITADPRARPALPDRPICADGESVRVGAGLLVIRKCVGAMCFLVMLVALASPADAEPGRAIRDAACDAYGPVTISPGLS